MGSGHSPTDCRTRADAERALAEVATLSNVRDRHLRAAARWDTLASEVRLMIEARLAKPTTAADPSVEAAGRESAGDRPRAATVSAEQRAQMAREASARRWSK